MALLLPPGLVGPHPIWRSTTILDYFQVVYISTKSPAWYIILCSIVYLSRNVPIFDAVTRRLGATASLTRAKANFFGQSQQPQMKKMYLLNEKKQNLFDPPSESA